MIVISYEVVCEGIDRFFILGLVFGLSVFGLSVQTVSATELRPREVFSDCQTCPKMIVVPAGKFSMGTNDGDDSERPKHIVTISKAFAVGIYEVTQAEWQSVMGANPGQNEDDQYPVENVSWDDASEYIHKLSDRSGNKYRLLSEAEWEYAARAGSTTLYYWGSSWGGDGNCARCTMDNFENHTFPVGSFPANGFGLYDMYGNVWEWVQDCRNPDYAEGPTTEAPRLTGNCTARMLRGGAWRNIPKHLRSSDRISYKTSVEHFIFGLRVAKTLP
jgi:formylglycine-generating enzyme required for sulfatase activity